MSRVYWNKDEIDLLADFVYSKKKNDISTNPCSLVREAQKHFAEDRQRKINSHINIKEVLTRVAELQQKENTLNTIPKVEETSIEPVIEPSAEHHEDVTLKGATLENLFIELLLRTFNKLVELGDIGNKVVEQLNIYTERHEASSIVRDNLNSIIQPKTTKYKVLVVGAQQFQHKYIIDAIGDKVNLRFVSSDSSKIHNYPEVDSAILVTKFVSHGMQNNIT